MCEAMRGGSMECSRDIEQGWRLHHTVAHRSLYASNVTSTRAANLPTCTSRIFSLGQPHLPASHKLIPSSSLVCKQIIVPTCTSRIFSLNQPHSQCRKAACASSASCEKQGANDHCRTCTCMSLQMICTIC